MDRKFDQEDPVQVAISKYEIKVLGIEDTKLIFPGQHVDAHIMIGNSECKVKFAARIFVIGGRDKMGNNIPVLTDVRESTQNWDTGGCYLSPELLPIGPESLHDYE